MLTVEFKYNMMAPAAGEQFVARGRVVRPGRTLTVVESFVYAVEGGAESEIGRMLATMMFLEGKGDMQETCAVSVATTYFGTVYPGETDHMGHMNVAYYVQKFDAATWNFFFNLGVTPSMMRENPDGHRRRRAGAELQERNDAGRSHRNPHPDSRYLRPQGAFPSRNDGSRERADGGDLRAALRVFRPRGDKSRAFPSEVLEKAKVALAAAQGAS